jgi:hypothetical protein
MYNSGLVEVKAGFSVCPSPYDTATCNCLLSIRILAGVFSGKYLEIDTCSSAGTWSVQDASGVVTCPDLGATSNQILSDQWWLNNPPTSVSPGFRCTKIGLATAVIFLIIVQQLLDKVLRRNIFQINM